jgi:RNA polymerase sigma-70 factor (ECF subfamily)
VGGDVRADLGDVFRRDYLLVVGVAARVLGSRHEAEDVAQDVFISFGRSSVPAGEARGWLSVAAAHTALNLLRSGRRRASREETVAAGATSDVADVAEAVVTIEEHNGVRAALARLPAPRPWPWCCATAACPTPTSPPRSTSPPPASAPPCGAPKPPYARS